MHWIKNRKIVLLISLQVSTNELCVHRKIYTDIKLCELPPNSECNHNRFTLQTYLTNHQQNTHLRSVSNS